MPGISCCRFRTACVNCNLNCWRFDIRFEIFHFGFMHLFRCWRGFKEGDSRHPYFLRPLPSCGWPSSMRTEEVRRSRCPSTLSEIIPLKNFGCLEFMCNWNNGYWTWLHCHLIAVKKVPIKLTHQNNLCHIIQEYLYFWFKIFVLVFNHLRR